MIDFTKFDEAKGFDLGGAAADDANMWEAMGEVIASVLTNSGADVLDGCYVYKIIADGRSYYPKQGTMRVLPTNWALFEDAAQSPDTFGNPVYITLNRARITSMQWEKEDTEGEVVEMPQAA